jgi:hypothetical protein
MHSGGNGDNNNNAVGGGYQATSSRSGSFAISITPDVRRHSSAASEGWLSAIANRILFHRAYAVFYAFVVLLQSALFIYVYPNQCHSIPNALRC